jgi:hypothetical protein
MVTDPALLVFNSGFDQPERSKCEYLRRSHLRLFYTSRGAYFPLQFPSARENI